MPTTGVDIVNLSSIKATSAPLVVLFEEIDKAFDKEELKDLCFRLESELGIDYDNLGGRGKKGKIRELVRTCWRHGKIGILVGEVHELRPESKLPELETLGVETKDKKEPSTKTKTLVRIWIKGNLRRFPQERLRILPELVGTILGISPNDISIHGIRAGSIIVILEMFVEHAVKLMTLFIDSPQLLSPISQHFEILNMSVGNNAPGQTDLSDRDLALVDLHETNLSTANLQRTDLRGADLYHADLTDAQLMKANLMWADMGKVNLTRANATGASMSGVDLRSAIMVEADLTNSNLVGTDMRQVNLTRANLSEANLTWANLTEAIASDEQLAKAALHYEAIHPKGTRYWPLPSPGDSSSQARQDNTGRVISPQGFTQPPPQPMQPPSQPGQLPPPKGDTGSR